MDIAINVPTTGKVNISGNTKEIRVLDKSVTYAKLADDVTLILSEKADKTSVDAELEQKADKAIVDGVTAALEQKSNKTEVLTKTNTTEFTPTANYQPATKKYVDDNISAAGGGDMMKSVYDMDGDGIVDNAEKLGGQPASYYVTAAQLKDLIDAKISAPPTLTATTADGTAIGADGWTGTGWYCKTANTKYAADSKVDSRLSGFNRFCLKPASDNGEWQNWTPYFDYNGTAYEFFYAPGRGLYEALIPSNTQTAAQIVAAIRWENHPPTKLMYGKLTNICGIYTSDCLWYDETDETVVTYWVRDSSEFRNTENRIICDDYAACKAIYLSKYDFSALDINMVALLYMAADVNAVGTINAGTFSKISMYIKGNVTRFPIQTIDNF